MKIRDEHRVLFYSLVASNLVFITNAAMESFFFHKKSFWNSYILDVSSFDVFLRTIIFAIFVLYGIATSQIIKKRILWGEKLLQSKVKMQALIDAFPDLLFRIRRDGRILEIVSSSEGTPLPSSDQILGKNIKDFLPEKQVEESMASIYKTLKSRKIQFLENNLLLMGKKRHYEARVVPSGKNEVLTIIRDITDKKELEEKLRFLSLRDELTGLYNRRGFFLLSQQQQKLAERDGNEMSLLFVDLDGLKEINDTFGHKEGDRLLVHTANLLQDTFRESDVIARLGGDEFVVLLIDSSGQAVETLISHRLEKNLEGINGRSDWKYELSLSYGISHYEPTHPRTIDELLFLADENMYTYKKSKQDEGAHIS